MFLLQFSSVYNACGLASYDLFDEIDFDLWFTNQLLHELNNSSSRYVSITSTSAKHYSSLIMYSEAHLSL